MLTIDENPGGRQSPKSVAGVTPRIVIAARVAAAASCAAEPERTRPASPVPSLPPRPSALIGPLVPAATTMVSAWDIPANLLTDPSLDNSPRGETIRLGYRIFTNTPQEAPG
jgi:hypothetical protein